MAKIKPQALLQQSKKKVPSKISPTTVILFALIVFMVAFFFFSTYRHFSHRMEWLKIENLNLRVATEYGKEYDYEALVKLLHWMLQSTGDELVVVSQVLVTAINIGYHEMVNTQLLAHSGYLILNLTSLANMVES